MAVITETCPPEVNGLALTVHALAARPQREYPDLVFTGLRRGEDLAARIASADLFLLPGLARTSGNVSLETMAAGAPA